MTNQLYAVMATMGGRDNTPLLQAVFSSEGLAQTHAAKLRLDELGITYTVEPLAIDSEVDHEMVYMGYYSIKQFGRLVLREEDIQISPAGLWRVLPEDTVADNRRTSTSQGIFNTGMLFYVYAWDRATAHRRTVQFVSDYLNRQGLEWTLIPWEDNEYE